MLLLSVKQRVFPINADAFSENRGKFTLNNVKASKRLRYKTAQSRYRVAKFPLQRKLKALGEVEVERLLEKVANQTWNIPYRNKKP